MVHWIYKNKDELQPTKESIQNGDPTGSLGGNNNYNTNGTFNGNITMDDGDAGMDAGESSASILAVLQRIKERPIKYSSANNINNGNNNNEQSQQQQQPAAEIWALIEFEETPPDDMVIATTPMNAMNSNNNYNNSNKRYRKWKRFEAETELQDFIRRDTGEPITLPPYSLAPEQSARIQEDAKKEVSRVMEEFRRFRVRSELARKQQDAHIKELQNSHVQTAQRRIEGQDLVCIQKYLL